MSGPTRGQVMAWAQHLGMAGMITDVVTTIGELESFAALAFAAGQAAEREACAKVADAESSIEGIAQRIASAIRARGQQ